MEKTYLLCNVSDRVLLRNDLRRGVLGHLVFVNVGFFRTGIHFVTPPLDTTDSSIVIEPASALGFDKRKLILSVFSRKTLAMFVPARITGTFLVLDLDIRYSKGDLYIYFFSGDLTVSLKYKPATLDKDSTMFKMIKSE